MQLLDRFLAPSFVSLKICGVTTSSDALALAAAGVDALGVNFWPRSKRYVSPDEGAWLAPLKGKILRVGVFVNEDPALPLKLYQEGWIDVVQLHGDEQAEDAAPFREKGVPFIKAVGVKSAGELEGLDAFGANALLLDAHAPGVYGGTGEVFDWNVAAAYRMAHPTVPLLLAGGIIPGNARLAAQQVAPAALDIASGAESAPGVKDFAKVAAFLEALDR